MEPRATPVPPPMQVRIADDLRIKIERGDLEAGDPLPAVHELARRWSTSEGTARSAIALLKQQGLITGGRGRAPVVRARPVRVVRSSDRHQAEKDLALTPPERRGRTGAAETDMGIPLDRLDFSATYDTVSVDESLASVLNIDNESEVLRRVYELVNPETGYRLAWSVSYIPLDLVHENPELLDSKNEPWPGGTMHQLLTVGIEVGSVVDEVSATMPTTAEQHLWGLDDGVPMLRVRRISIDISGRPVEISDADYPADRTELRFTTQLRKWPKSRSANG